MPPYIGEIRLWPGNFAPLGWLLCQGQSLDISEYDTLFNLIGTTYGGDGESTFNLPDLQGRVPLHQGQSQGQTYVMGQRFGVESVTINQSTTPNHTHPFQVSSSTGGTANPQGNVLHQPTDIRMYLRAAPGVGLPTRMVDPAGESQPHENMPPVLSINFIISLYGVYPPPS
ncbi:MAG: tail fiber protein [Herbiconiux sp.]|nr:tail fiber protein [Herbiconiux sp.]